MRFHRLTMTAFGPYADTQCVDFDELNDAGVFLLTGPTGAGKTSILDAVCFALYGVVPGVRDVRTLRSHHAPPDLRPEVVLELTLGERRYRVHRSPEWVRPKKKGVGTTREHASARLLEMAPDGTERLVSHRAAEVGHELQQALGMSSEQFMQVVMLPQGDFQRFLHASSDERQGVLERLFRTQRFARVEDWVRERSKQLGARAADAERRVAQLLATIADRSGLSLPAELALTPLGDVAAEARSWAASALAVTDATLQQALAVEAQHGAAREEAEERLVQATRAQRARERRDAALTTLADLAATQDEAERRRELLARHDRAAVVAPLLAELPTLREARRAASAHQESCVADARATVLAALDPLDSLDTGVPAPHDRAGWRAAQARLRERLTLLQAAAPKQAALELRARELGQAGRELSDIAEAAGRVRERVATLPGECQEARERLLRAREAAARVDGLRTALASALARLEAAEALPDAERRHVVLADRHRAARDQAQEARERHLDLVERRLAGMAAELAGELRPGEACVVCGSTDHPRPAGGDESPITESEQDAAREEAERLRAVAEELAHQAGEAEQALTVLRTAAAGACVTEARAAAEDAQRALDEATRSAQELEALERRQSVLDDESRSLAGEGQRLAAAQAALETSIRSLDAEVAGLQAEVEAALGPQGGTLPAATDAVSDAHDLVTAVLDSLDQADEAERRWREAQQRVTAAAVGQGFADIEDLVAAQLDTEAREVLQQALAARHDQERSARAVLEEPDVEEFADCGAPDLAEADARRRAAVSAWQESAERLGAARDTVDAVRDLVDRLHEAVSVWEPLRREHAVADGMARLVRGVGADNQLQMRLSSYVLATRLDQVLDAANERLSQMRDQRYTLRRCGAVRGNARAGLGLEVLDAWTGEARSPSTLSGGETFVVSLALALGLADVVTQESGGLRVETLFIDEGFGMLDPDTLDDVMDRIDDLRAGGRAVGVVSHVTELRSRIPTQLHVTRGRTGSTLRVRTLVA